MSINENISNYLPSKNNLDLKRQLANAQIEKLTLEQNSGAGINFGPKADLEMFEKCELILQNKALKTLNVNLQVTINQLKRENVDLMSRVAHLEEKGKKTDKMVSIMAQKLFKFAPMSFRLATEHLLAKKYQSDNLKTEYLIALNQYFNSFVHKNSTNSFEVDTEEMANWVEATLDDHSSMEKLYKFEQSKKPIIIKLEKIALEEIIKLCETEQQTDE